jgi:hypothetical protein
MRVKLNDVGKENGELELWANGKSMFVVDGLVIRNSEDGLVWGDQMQTFFGGMAIQLWYRIRTEDIIRLDARVVHT